MSNAVCLTTRQQKFYNYFINYQKEHGHFPNPSQTVRDLKCSNSSVYCMYGTLLLKGVFTDGQPLTNGNRARHNATPIQSVNITAIKVNVKPKQKAERAAPAIGKRQLANLLVKLLTEDKLDKATIAQLIA